MVKEQELIKKNFFSVIKALAETTDDEKAIRELINLEDLIHGINIKRIFYKKPRFETLTSSLVKNQNLTAEDFSALFDVLNIRWTTTNGEYRELIKKKINMVYVEIIKRSDSVDLSKFEKKQYKNLLLIISSQHPGINKLKAVQEFKTHK